MKIFNCLFTTSVGGMEQSFLDYTKSLKALGHEVILILHKHTQLLPYVNAPYFLNNSRSKHDFIARWQLSRLVQKEQPALIITHGNRAHYLMNKVKGRAKTLGICHGNFGDIANSDYGATVSQSLKAQNPKAAFYLPNMVEITEKHQVLKPNSIPVLGMIGRLDPEKGVVYFIEALNKLKLVGVEFKAKIAGEGSEKEQLIKLVCQYNLSEQVEFMGWVHNKKDFYDHVDIVCVPSLMKSFGIVILEACMHSKPLIVSNLPGPMEIVHRGETALVVEPGDVNGLYNAMVQLMENTELYQRLSKNAYGRALDFGADAFNKQLALILDKIKPSQI